jgi:predicted dehydrogenase
MKTKAGVGIIGCGNISDIYMTNLSTRFPNVQLVACADMLPDRAKAKAEHYGIEARSIDKLLASSDIDIIVDLTIPLAHAEVNLKILEAGKHVYSEKPLAAKRVDGARIIAKAKEKGLLVGGAPDTFLGAGIQTCRRLIAEGAIGKPIGGTANMLCPGHESWHPDPGFYYKPGGGPVLDMGPYYITALTELIGPVAAVSAYAASNFAERIIGSGPKQGQKITVEVATHVNGLLRFASGAIISLAMSFDVQKASLPFIELWGTEGSMMVPDPNNFGGPVRVFRRGVEDWTEETIPERWSDNSRGLGISDMASALLAETTQRATGQRCFHVLDVMESLHDAAAQGRECVVTSTF